MNKDIFEDMYFLIQCDYLSDLRVRKQEVIKKLKNMNYIKYPLPNLIDFFEYVFQKDVQSYQDIKTFLKIEILEELK